MSVTRWVSDLGPTNPIILRIVANGSRRTRHLWIRSGFLALLMVALLAFQRVNRYSKDEFGEHVRDYPWSPAAHIRKDV
jgi:hypothetical protein